MVSADHSTRTSPLDLVLGIWRRRRWIALAVFTIPFAGISTAVASLPAIYQATARIIVTSQQVPAEFVRSTVTTDLGGRLQTISQEVQSRARLDELIKRFGLYTDLRRRMPIEDVVERMRADIKVELGSDIGSLDQLRQLARGRENAVAAFNISYRGADPQTVALVANTLATLYIEENLKVRERQAAGTAEFLRTQVEETKQRLDGQERRISDFKKRHPGEMVEFLPANLQTLERLHTQFRVNAENQTRTADRREALVKQLNDIDSTGSATTPDAIAARLSRLRQDLTELRSRFSDRYPEVIRVNSEITTLEAQLAAPRAEPSSAARAVASSPVALRLRQQIADLEVDLKGLKAEERNLRVTIASYHARVENAPRREQEMQELSRDYESTKTAYRTLLQRYEEAQLSENMEQRQKGEQFRFLDSAVPPTSPAAPKTAQLFFVGLMMSLGLGAGVALLVEQLDSSFHRVEELRSFTPVPILVSIPDIVSEARIARERRRFQIMLAAAIAGVIVIIGVAYLVAHGNERLVFMLLPKKI